MGRGAEQSTCSAQGPLRERKAPGHKVTEECDGRRVGEVCGARGGEPSAKYIRMSVVGFCGECL